MNLDLINHALLLVIILIAIVIDWRTKKIPNWLTFPGALCGIILNFLAGSWHGAWMAAAGWLVAAVVSFILGNIPIGAAAKGGGIGMGDVKLLAVIGAFLGPKNAIVAIFYFCLCFGLMAWVILLARIPWKQVGVLVSTAIFDGDTSGIKIDTSKLTAQRQSAIPASAAIFLAAILTIYFGQQTLSFIGWS